MFKRKPYGSVIITYRCNAHCNMCGCYKDPTRKEEEFNPDILYKLPEMAFANITGGEPFIRRDIPDIVKTLYNRTNRIVISTNGYYSDRIISLCEEFPHIGIRISIEGLQQTNDAIRGLPGGFERGCGTLRKLVDMGHKDVGFGMTVQDLNCDDLIPLYELSDELNMEFATAALHNSFYFRKEDNMIRDKYRVSKAFEALINELLKSKSPKKWARAYFNHGLINYIYGRPRLLPCGMASNAFFLDPFGDVIPCNGMKEKIPMGNLHEQSWEELWNSQHSKEIRNKVKHCDKNCWMIGSAAPAMIHRIWVPGWWIMKHKLLLGSTYKLSENRFISDAGKWV